MLKSSRNDRAVLLLAALAFLVIAIIAPSLVAQTSATGALTGTVVDQQNGSIPNVAITLTNVETGQVRTTATGADGSYKFNLLSPGTYRVRFEAQGFKSTEVDSLIVHVTETPVLDRHMEVGTQNQEVTVQAEAEAVQTSSSTLGTLVNSKTITDLPLSTRNFTNLVSLAAGANAAVNDASALGSGVQNVAVNGSSAGQNNWQQDGISVVDAAGANTFGGHNGQIPLPNPDSITEFKIQTSTYDASYGRNSGANVNVVTKSGTNSFHGTAFDFFRNTALNANDWFSSGTGGAKSALNQNQYGGVIGGPVKKDKLFFFVSYQETYQKNGYAAEGNSTGLRFAPIPSGNRGTCPAGITTIAQMQAQCDAATQTFLAALGAATCPAGPSNPGCTNANSQSTPFRNAYCSAAQATANTVVNGTTCTVAGQRNTGVDVNFTGNNISPQAIQILQLKLSNGSYYVPGSGTASYSSSPINISLPAIFHEHQGSGNWDYIINQKHTLSGRYFFLTNPTDAPFVSNGFLPGTPQSAETGNQIALLKLTSVLTNTFINDVHIGYVRNSAVLNEPLIFKAPQVGIFPINPGGPFNALPDFTISGLFAGGIQHNGTMTQIVNNYSVADQISWSHGKQTIRAGFEVTRIQYKWLQPSYQWGGFAFQTFADFLLGLPGCATTGSACNTSALSSQAGGAGVLPAAYSPLGTSTNGTAFSNVDNVAAATNRTDPSGLLHYFNLGQRSAFVQDDIKLSSRLTINVGLRWEFNQFTADKYGDGVNIWANLIQTQVFPGSGCVYSGAIYGLGAAGTGCSFAGYVAPSNYSVALRGPLPSGVYLNSRTDPTASGPPKDNFAPRLGFAWQPFSTPRFVVRGGTGYFYDVIAGNVLGPPINQEPPYNNSINLSGTANYNSSFAQPFQPGPLGWTPRWVNFANGTGSNFNPAGNQGPITPNLVTPLTYNYNLQVQYEFLPSWVLEIGYVGSHAIHQTVPNPINAAPLASVSNPINCGYDGNPTHCITTNGITGANGPGVRSPYLGFAPSFHVASSTGGTKFNSLQATVRKQLSHGLSMNAAYTWSRAFILQYIGNPNASFSNNVPVIQTYGLNTNYRPQRFVMNFSWALPFGRHTGLLEKVSGGWTVTGVATFQSGAPLNITDSRMGTVFGSPGSPVVSPALFAAGKSASDVSVAGSVQSKLLTYFNASAFCVPSNTTGNSCLPVTPQPGGAGNGFGYGNAGLGIVRGPGQNNWDLSLSKLTTVGGLREDATLEFRSEFFNAFNHPQFANPATAFNSSSSFGQISSMSVNSRLLQFALKYRF